MSPLPSIYSAHLRGESDLIVVSPGDRFKIEGCRRTDAAKLSLAQCTQILRRTAQASGIPVTVSDPSEPTVAITGGRGDGKGAIVAYCISAGDKTIHVVQGIGYRPRASVAAFADEAHAALLKAAS
ncbi:DUF6180 family protein [Methylobacterium sp. NEAU 140]|uniref:DUF6180 family protein n=1 Tax=Methylobacterium sp. NEAU 140 TaxID=3064945 RepID=UPI0027340606|nr:DUF6180 family protein [Methylobacterium sp. NEAU 140]MDP4025767.1 DUF6180 family protein [Methylobacterium sp. NEAU 140]